MANTPEGRVKAQVKRVLDAHGVWYYMPVQNGMGVTGIPDFVCCWRGLFIGLECKAPGKEKTLTVGQARVGGQIRDAGGYWYVVTGGEEALKALATVRRIKEGEGS